jgi:peptidoglycan lytic transglycosylase D
MMKRSLHLLIPAFILPVCLFLILSVPVIESAIDSRRPLLSVYDISQQLTREIGHAETAKDGLPTRYSSIVAEYGGLEDSKAFRSSRNVPAPPTLDSQSVISLAELILWKHNLPGDLLSRDPAGEIAADLEDIRRKEEQMEARRERLLVRHRLECLRHELPKPVGKSTVRIGLPAALLRNGLVFCGERIPLERDDVRRRIAHQIEYLVTDFYDNTVIWLARKDRYGRLVNRILKQQGLPAEFSLLPALESGYSSRVFSPSRARGWWQFGKPTATKSLAKDPQLDWTLIVNGRRDERCDLVLSTTSAAKYLKWLRRKLSKAAGKGSWLTTAAAYNAGLTKVRHRAAVYNTSTYWNMKLPHETETYVPRWIALCIIDASREYYGMNVPTIEPVRIETIHGLNLKRDLPLRVLASITESSESFIREINGAIEKGETSVAAQGNGGTFAPSVHVPAGSGQRVLRELEARSFLKK